MKYFIALVATAILLHHPASGEEFNTTRKIKIGGGGLTLEFVAQANYHADMVPLAKSKSDVHFRFWTHNIEWSEVPIEGTPKKTSVTFRGDLNALFAKSVWFPPLK